MTDRSAYWDSCSFIHLFQKKKPEYYDPLAGMIAKARSGELTIITSSVTIAEVYKLPELGPLPVEQSDKILACLENDYIHVWQADVWVCKDAHHLIRYIPALRPMDAIHLATALMAKVDVLITSDVKKYRRGGLLAHDGKLGEPPLKIKLPGPEAIGPLFNRDDETTGESEEEAGA